MPTPSQNKTERGWTYKSLQEFERSIPARKIHKSHIKRVPYTLPSPVPQPLAPLASPISVAPPPDIDFFQFERVPEEDEFLVYPAVDAQPIWGELEEVKIEHNPYHPKKNYQSIDTLSFFVHEKPMLVRFKNDHEGFQTRVLPIPLDGVDGFFERMQNVDVKLGTEDFFWRVYSSVRFSPFTELDRRVRRLMTSGNHHGLCILCVSALNLWQIHKVGGSYKFADLIAKNITTYGSAMSKHPCTCGLQVANRIIGLIEILIDGVLMF